MVAHTMFVSCGAASLDFIGLWEVEARRVLGQALRTT